MFTLFILSCSSFLEFPWNQEENLLPIIPALHGTDKAAALQICQMGFATLSSLYVTTYLAHYLFLSDAGWYGQGMYFSSESSYILPFCENRPTPAILLCYVIPGNIYPVTDDHQGPTSLLGKPVVPGFQSHYVLVNKDGKVYNSGVDDEIFDEIVLFQENSVCFP